jgi:hypothetical protein
MSSPLTEQWYIYGSYHLIATQMTLNWWTEVFLRNLPFYPSRQVDLALTLAISVRIDSQADFDRLLDADARA